MDSEIFTKIYNTNTWNSKESKSGSGSTLHMTQSIQKYIPLIVKEYNIKHFMDVPCGDFNWMKEIIHTIPNYVGCDIVSDLIESNNLDIDKILDGNNLTNTRE